jgi:hypothetical protein
MLRAGLSIKKFKLKLRKILPFLFIDAVAELAIQNLKSKIQNPKSRRAFEPC